MILFLEITLLIVAVVLFIPCTFLLVECLAAVLPANKKQSEVKSEQVFDPLKVSILVPAHNESSGIRMTLETLLSQVSEPKNIVVIADNCNDDTAAIAREYGVTVIERENSQHRGKGYALDYGLQFLETNPPEIVVTVDADCIVAPQTVENLARLAKTTNRPVQATYLMEQPANPSSKDVISTLAVRVKNLVRPYGLLRLGFPSLLTGSGMAFPWQVIRKISLANSKTVDDMQSSIDLAIAGYPTMYCDRALVTGRLMEKEAAKSQRTRWEHGHLETLLTQSPRLLKAAIAQKRYELLALALEITIPALSLLVILWMGATGIASLAAALGLSWIPLAILILAGFSLFCAVTLSWVKFCRTDIPGKSLLAIPFYLLWKVPLYIAYSLEPQTKWLKTERDNA
ncbi:glycosyltransferase family 2 protein [Candidatus Gracilibacteria bacterium]|nr:glycosyltransferase family 2 protein [Candidatus Gracilibacteria bacterium]NJM87999.1 glycosyltransferase family 2 protein [Hydrococcus sp. RU_2_2]